MKKEYYWDEFSKAMKEYFDYERIFYNYMEQFFTTHLNGVLQHEATRRMDAKENEIVEGMRKELELKRKNFKVAEDKLHSFYKK